MINRGPFALSPGNALKSQSGQVMMIGVFLLIVILITIPAILFLNKSSTQHGVSSLKKSKGRLIAEEGIAYAIRQLSTYTDVSSPNQAAGVAGPGFTATNASSFIAQSRVPTVMFPNQVVPVTIEYRNMGGNPWLIAGPSFYSLGAQNPQNTPNWNHPSRAPQRVPVTANVASSSNHIFQFLVTAPAQPRIYEFQWGMISEGAVTEWFGVYTPNVTVEVHDLPSPPANWPYLGGILPAAETIESSQGGKVELSYTAAPNTLLQNYQVGIRARALDGDGNVIPGGSLFATVSHKTVGVKLPSGLSASAVIQLTNPPTGNGNLEPHWGPIALFSADPLVTNPFVLKPVLDINRFPRKFSSGPITGALFPRAATDDDLSTDNLEYWAFENLGFPAPIDLLYYQKKAQDTNIGFAGLGTWSCGGTGGCWHEGNSGYFYVPPGATLTIDGTGGADWKPIWPVSETSENVIFIDGGQYGMGGGNAVVKNVAIELKNKGAFIVTGNMTIGERRDNSGLDISNAFVPMTAPLEYPFNPAFFCAAFVGKDCDVSGVWGGVSPTRPSIRGFVYAMKKLTVVDHAAGEAGHDTTLAGTLRVDDTLDIPDANVTLHTAMDIHINHAIRTANFDLQIDTMTVLP